MSLRAIFILSISFLPLGLAGCVGLSMARGEHPAAPGLAGQVAASPSAVAPLASPAASPAVAPAQEVVARTYDARQSVRLAEIPAGSKRVQLWVCVPNDSTEQRVLDLAVAEAPAGWHMVTEPEYGNRFLYCEIAEPANPEIAVVVDYTAQRIEQVPGNVAASCVLRDDHRKIFASDLRLDTPLMSVSDEARRLAAECVQGETDAMRAADKIAAFVADYADHYSKDATKPKCGRGAAEDCLLQKGGCCTDLHSLFIALARAQGIPCRLQFGYRLQAKNDGLAVDPGYRCWVEYFAPGLGWVATDVVVADSVPVAERAGWFRRLDDRRVWCSSGRDFDLVPKQNGPKINTMIIGYAEIDGRPVPLLPSADGKPSPLSRTVQFTERKPAVVQTAGARSATDSVRVTE